MTITNRLFSPDYRQKIDQWVQWVIEKKVIIDDAFWNGVEGTKIL